MNRQRRKALRDIIDQLETLRMQLEDLQTEEEDYRDNFPESLQNSERYERTEEICESLSDAVDEMEQAASRAAVYTTANLSGRGPSILLRKTVLSLKVPTGDFIASQTRILLCKMLVGTPKPVNCIRRMQAEQVQR